MPSLKINSRYYFLCCPGLKGKVFKSQYEWFPVSLCHLISSLVAMPAQCPYTVCALSYSIICEKPNQYTCSFIGKQKILQVRFTMPQLAVCQQHSQLYGPWAAQQMVWRSHRSTGSVSPLKRGTGKKAGHTQRPQLACVVSISCKLLSLNISFTQLNLSKISVFLKSTPAYCFSCRQLKKDNSYIRLSEI